MTPETYQRITGPVTLTVTFSAVVSGLSASNFQTLAGNGNATLSAPTRSATDQKVWTATLTPSGRGTFQTQLFQFTGIDPGAGNAVVWAHSTWLVDVYYDAPPAFSAATATASVAENTAATANIATLSATDANTDIDTSITYAVSTTAGVDRARFQIADTNKLRFASSFVPDYENPQDVVSTTPANAASNNEYIVVVTATSGSSPSQTATQTLTVTVTDVNEPPPVPTALTVTPATSKPTELPLSWTAPVIPTGTPALSGYDVQYKLGTATMWSDWTHTGTTASATLTGLTAGTAYNVRVRATNAEGESAWVSQNGTTPANVAPVFSSSTTAFNVAENSTAVTTATATDADTVTTDAVSYTISGGADSAKFSINASTGAVTFASAPDYENPTDAVSPTPANAATNNVYVVTITATSGTGARQLSVSKTLIVTVTDVNEPPPVPTALTVTPAASEPTELPLSWTAPVIPTGTPALSGYDVQYKLGTATMWSTWAHSGTTTSATLTGLTAGTAYNVRVRATNAEGESAWVSQNGTTPTHVAPVFSSSTTAFNVAENSTAVTTATATDSDSGDAVSYAISGGADSAKFSINASTGAVTFASAPDFENPTDAVSPTPVNAANNNEYVVTIRATSGTGARQLSVSKTLIVTVTDEAEPPPVPTALTVTPAASEPTELPLSWTAPVIPTGTPALSGYDVQYKLGTATMWSTWTHTGTTVSATLTGLTAGTAYNVRVRATNAEGESAWVSQNGTTPANVAPVFSSSTTAFNVAENSTAVTTATATDADTVTTDAVSYTISGGADSAKFSINASTGAVTFASAPDYENPTDAVSPTPANAATNNVYVVTITATSGTGARQLSVSKTLIVTVTDVAEAPGKPATPQVTATTVTSITVSWSAPTNTGPAITDYDVQYRVGNTGSFTAHPHTGTGTTATITGLTQGTSLEIQVRATNAEDTGPWSDAVTGTSQPNDAPVFSSSDVVTVAENTPASTAVVTVVATDVDSDDEITGYSLSGTDSGAFTFSSGVLRFRVSPDFENPTDAAHTTPAPADAAGNNTYIVLITATSGTGGRQLSTTQRLTVTVTGVDEMSIGLVFESSVALTGERRVTSEPNWTVSFDFSESLATVGDAAFSVGDISVTGEGAATFGELTLSDASSARYTVPVTVTTEGTYTFQVKSGSVGTLTGDTYSGAASPLVVIYNTPPVITDVAVVPPPATGYTVGSELALELTFDDDNVDIPANVDIANRPYIVLYLGERTEANQRRAYWQAARDANSTVVTFVYEVQPGDVASVIHWAPRIVVPETAPISNGVSEVVISERTGTDSTSDTGPGGIVAFPGDTAQPSQGQPQQPASPLTQEVPVLGSPVLVLPPTETVQPVKPTQIPRTPLIFNEIGNGAVGANDWVELRNVTAEAVPLKNWGISIVADGEKVEVPLVVFPSDAPFSIPPNGILLLTQRPPDKTRLAGGVDITVPGGAKAGQVHRYFIAPKLTLPGDGQFLLMLRNATGQLGKGEHVIDVAGGGGRDTDAFIADKGHAFQTDIWPLRATKHPRENTGAALAEGKVWRRDKADIVGYHKEAWTQAAYTGVGYERAVENAPATAGTPGYPNDAVKPVAATPRGSVTLSEIMVDSAGGTLPQWIEVYNASKTAALNLNRWKLDIQNVDSEDLVGRPVVTLTLKEKVIQPNQTLLIVAGDARAASADVFPASRVYNLLALHQKNLRIKSARDTFLSAEGFTLKLSDKNGALVDEVGNTDGNRRTHDAPAWQLPFAPAESGRSSLIRRYDKGTAEDGKVREGWVLAANINRFSADVYYGRADDKGTPGYREGGPLPVELAHFQIARTDAGVVIEWATASEVNNAGFSILRSETGKAAFRSITPRLLLGAGTTGERSAYAFTDKTAKPGVAYTYRLEEVSLAGHRETLATQRVKAGFTPAHRHLTTFGAVKQRK